MSTMKRLRSRRNNAALTASVARARQPADGPPPSRLEVGFVLFGTAAIVGYMLALLVR